MNLRHLMHRRKFGELATGAAASLAVAQIAGRKPALAAPVASPVASPVPSIDLQATIDALVPSDGGVYGFVVQDPDGTDHYRCNPGVPFVAASLYKLPLMAHIHKLAESGIFALSDVIWLDEWFWSEGDDSYYDWSWMGAGVTIDELLYAMGAWSSNVAAWALATLVDWWDVQVTANEIGMTGTIMFAVTPELAVWPPVPGDGDSEDDMWTASSFIDTMYGWSPVMITTPGDIATYFRGLLAGTVVSEFASQAIYDVLAMQVINDRLPALLPEGTTVVHKTGNLLQVVHDAGIIYTNTGPVIVVGMSEAFYDEWGAWNALQQLALTVYDAFSVPVATS